MIGKILRRAKNIVFPIIFLTLACCFASCGRQASPSGNPAGTPAQAVSEPAGITTSVASLSTVTQTITMPGQVNATEAGRADVTAPLTGVILQPLIKLGDNVTRGQPLAILDSVYGQTSLQALQKIETDETAVSQAEDNASQAKSELTNAGIALRREKILYHGGVAARADVDDAEERYEKADAVARDTANLLNIARISLGRDRAIFRQTQIIGSSMPQNLTPVPLSEKEKFPGAGGSVLFYIRAPISGTVTNYAISAGFSVTPGSVLATITNTGKVYVDANAYESDLPFVRAGDEMTATDPSIPDRKFRGRVAYVGKQVDPTTRTAIVRSLVENSDSLLRPGMFVTAVLARSRPLTALMVPDGAVLIQGGNRYVYVEAAPGRFEKRAVKTGISVGGKTEITKGVSAGEKVVTRGDLLLEGEE